MRPNMILSKHIINSLSDVFERHNKQVIFAYLFGSAAHDDMSTLSDIDIAVFLYEGNEKSYFDIKLALYADLCRNLHRNDIDVVVLNTTRNIILLDEIIRYGKVLYGRDSGLRMDFEHKVLHRAIDFKQQRFSIMGI
jgi:hypothetical protein